MNETMEVDLTNKQVIADQLAVTVVSGIAGLVAGKLAEKAYRFAITAYRLRKTTA